jgi:hypothetical protein
LIKVLNLSTAFGEISGYSSIITFPQGAFSIAIFSGLSKLILFGS